MPGLAASFANGIIAYRAPTAPSREQSRPARLGDKTFEQAAGFLRVRNGGDPLDASAISNIANFGAFVDIGVHQDGLVHVSALSGKFVKDPREVVKAGQVVKVKVLEVDVKRGRIALTMRLDDVVGDALVSGGSANRSARGPSNQKRPQGGRDVKQAAPVNSAMSDALAGLLKR